MIRPLFAGSIFNQKLSGRPRSTRTEEAVSEVVISGIFSFQ